MLKQEVIETRVPSGRTFSVNIAESPLSWLRARNLVEARQFEAGERLRGDYDGMRRVGDHAANPM